VKSLDLFLVHGRGIGLDICTFWGTQRDWWDG